MAIHCRAVKNSLRGTIINPVASSLAQPPADRIRDMSIKKYGESVQGTTVLSNKPSASSGQEVSSCDRIRDVSIKEHSKAWENCAGYDCTK